jgi:hypothetical protein
VDAHNDRVYRRIRPDWVLRDPQTKLILPGPDGLPVITGQAFKPKDGGVSVALGAVMLDKGISPADLLAGYDTYGLAWLSCADVNDFGGLTIEPDPREEEPAHANIRGLRKRTPKRLAELAEWEIVILG